LNHKEHEGARRNKQSLIPADGREHPIFGGFDA
jgi:hypothetical protein